MPEISKEWIKEHYPDLVDFENLQFVKDCKMEGKNEVVKLLDTYLESDRGQTKDFNDLVYNMRYWLK